MHFVIRRTVTQAKGELSALVEQALRGEDVILSRSGRPVIRLVPVELDTRTREPGGIEGAWIADDFDSEDMELNALFEDGKIG